MKRLTIRLALLIVCVLSIQIHKRDSPFCVRFEIEQQYGYIRIDKETMAMSVVSEEEIRNIKANQE